MRKWLEPDVDRKFKGMYVFFLSRRFGVERFHCSLITIAGFSYIQSMKIQFFS